MEAVQIPNPARLLRKAHNNHLFPIRLTACSLACKWFCAWINVFETSLHIYWIEQGTNWMAGSGRQISPLFGVEGYK